MKRAIKKAIDIILLGLMYISRFVCTVTLVLSNPALEHPGLIYVSREEYYMFGGTYWQNTWSSFFVMAVFLLVDSWLFYFLSAKHREKVVKPFLITDLICVFLTIILWNHMISDAHDWVLFFFWLLLHCLKRFLDYYAYIRRDPKKNSLLPILPKTQGGTDMTVYVTAYIVVIILFVYRFFRADNGVSMAGCLAIAVAMSFALTVYLSKKKADNPQENSGTGEGRSTD